MEPRNPTSAFFFQNQMQFFFFFFFFKPNLLYLEPTFGMAGAKHTQTDTHDSFFQKFVLVTFVMWTENKLFSRKGIS